MLVVHVVQDALGNEVSREELSIVARNEKEFERWLDGARQGFARKGISERRERYWAMTGKIPEQTHYWWSASPYDAS